MNRGAWPTGTKETVARALQTYADRGVFRSFSETDSGFRFNWLWDVPFHLTFDSKRHALVFKKLLPKIPAGSEMDLGIKTFIASCSSADRPEHRRVDTKRLRVRYLRGSLTFVVLDGKYEYAVKQAINLVNEILLGFVSGKYPEYMVEHFRLPEDWL